MFDKMIEKVLGGKPVSTVASGQMAPPFELTRTDGKSDSLQAALAHGPVLVAFFKVSCPTCQYALPFVERIYQQLRDKGVQIWGASQDNARDSQRFAKEYGLTFPILIDDDNYATSRAYGLTHVPTLFLIAPDGHVEIASDGFLKADLLEIQRRLAKHSNTTAGELFKPGEKVPEFKPG